MVNKVRVTIAGAPYAIATTDTENYITTLAKKLDDDITRRLVAMTNNGNWVESLYLEWIWKRNNCFLMCLVMAELLL